eukprot:6197739-Pleurochrysis_carterae.AAC.4
MAPRQNMSQSEYFRIHERRALNFLLCTHTRPSAAHHCRTRSYVNSAWGDARRLRAGALRGGRDRP